jgi:hypothetical protein
MDILTKVVIVVVVEENIVKEVEKRILMKNELSCTILNLIIIQNVKIYFNLKIRSSLIMNGTQTNQFYIFNQNLVRKIKLVLLNSISSKRFSKQKADF